MLACSTALDVFVHELFKTWPPELDGDELAGFEITRVAGSFVVVAVSEDGVMEGVSGGI